MLDTIILLIAWSTLIGMGIASLRAINMGWQPFMWLHVLTVAGVWALVGLRYRIEYRLRCLLLLALLFVAGIAGYTGLGPAADAKVAFVFIAFIAGLFLPLRWMLAIWGLLCVSLLLVGFAWVSGYLSFKHDFSAHAADPLVWSTGLWSILVYSCVVAYVAYTTINLLHRKTIRIARQAEYTQSLLDSLHDSVLTTDTRGVIQFGNPAALRCFNYSRQQLMGQHISQLVPALEHLGQHIPPDKQASVSGKMSFISKESEGVRVDGTRIPVELTVTEIVRDKDTEYMVTAHDISERKRTERMKAEFVATVSHELRTPLTTISGALGLVSSGTLGALPDRAAEILTMASNNSKRLTLLINDLLDFEKIDAGHMQYQIETHTLLPILEQAVAAHATYSSQQNVQLKLIPPSYPVNVCADENRLMQVLANLLSNAIKFSPPDGAVILSTEVIDDHVRISVVDHGPGVPTEFQTRLFERFAQADASSTRRKGGTGLGLAISRELVAAMGGRMGYQSSPGQGACFWFELPLALN
ncbi:MAG: PAS domain-containing sensor histidine kinase [Marinobacter sp.]|nr:PAS domain-containing sensor histidine kinase [Marinobacter sp.]